MTEKAAHHTGYRLYLNTWLVLLVATFIMLVIEYLHLPRVFMVVTLVAFMLIKASFIAGNFMHLRFERKNLIVGVIVGLLITGAVLFFLIWPDARHVFTLSHGS